MFSVFFSQFPWTNQKEVFDLECSVSLLLEAPHLPLLLLLLRENTGDGPQWGALTPNCSACSSFSTHS